MRRLLLIARIYLMLGQPLPVDLTARLLAAGVDVAAFERRFSA